MFCFPKSIVVVFQHALVRCYLENKAKELAPMNLLQGNRGYGEYNCLYIGIDTLGPVYTIPDSYRRVSLRVTSIG